MTKMKGTFPQSRDLKKIIESHHWTLYDVSNPPEGRAHKWEEIENMTPADRYEVGHNYLFVPIPKKVETLRQAYTPTKGLGPSLFIEDAPGSEEWTARWAGLYNVTNRYYERKPILFTRLEFTPDFLAAFTPKTIAMPESDSFGIWYPRVIDTFRKYFRIISPEECGLKVPIPMSIVPEMN